MSELNLLGPYSVYFVYFVRSFPHLIPPPRVLRLNRPAGLHL